MRKIIALVFLFFLLSISSPPMLVPSSYALVPELRQPPIRICSLLYLWYGFNSTAMTWTGGLGTSHWNDSSYAIVKDTPDFGFYSSLAEIPMQLQLMREAGLNCVLVSWWGWGVTDFSESSKLNVLNEAVNNATKQVFADIAQLGDSTFQVGLLVDAFNDSELTTSDYSQIYNYTWNHFYAPYQNSTLQRQGKPLLMWFNPLVPPPDSRFTSRVIGNNLVAILPRCLWRAPYSSFDSSGGNANPGNGYEGAPQVSVDGFVSILPSYDDYYLYLAGSRQGYMRVDSSLSKGLYQLEWNFLDTQVTQSSNLHLILIYSWNEYHEGSEIEPHLAYAYHSLQEFYLYNLTKLNISRLLSAESSYESIATNFPYSILAVAALTLTAAAAILIKRKRKRSRAS